LLVGGCLRGFALQAAGPAARARLQPAVSFLLLIFALCLIFDYPLLSGRSPLTVPRAGTPAGSALLLGLFMGLIILPCNAAVILFLLTLAISVGTAAEAIGLFLAFGIGIVLPLLILSGISRFRSRQVLSCLTRHRLAVQRTAGLVMLAVAAGYLALALFTGVP
ncbi:cytochrome c biogenesis protein CcdA, partial [Methanoregula sp.]|uniref:cytochrome c biogenesis protein CcdA n=1 Tax=Methanoregula sp. TaxID=2052170 RepID=UPI0025FD36AC